MATTVFAGNLAWTTTSETLSALVATVVPPMSAEVQVYSDSGRSKGWGLLTFAGAEDARRVIEELNGVLLEGRKIFLREDRSAIEQEEGVVVFVGNLSWSATSQSLGEAFAEYRPLDVHVKTNMAGKSRGFALVKFRTMQDAEAAIQGMGGQELGGRKLQVRLDRAHLEEAGASIAVEVGDAVAVGNLSWDTQDNDLAVYMSTAGTVVSCQIQRHADTGRSKGWAIVRYAAVDQAAHAIRDLHRASLHGRSLNIRYYKPQRLEDGLGISS